MQNLHTVRVVAFKNATLATLLTNMNKFLEGKAVTAVETGTVAYAAGFSRGLKLHDQQYRVIAGDYSVMLFYSE